MCPCDPSIGYQCPLHAKQADMFRTRPTRTALERAYERERTLIIERDVAREQRDALAEENRRLRDALIERVREHPDARALT